MEGGDFKRCKIFLYMYGGNLFSFFPPWAYIILARIRRNLSTGFKFAINISFIKRRYIYNLVFGRSSATNGIGKQHWWDWGHFKAICAEALKSHLAGEPLQPLDRQWESGGTLQKKKGGNVRTSREENLIAWRSIWKHWGDPYLKANWHRHRVK